MRVTAPNATSTRAQRIAELKPLLQQVAARAHQMALPRSIVLETLAGLLPKDDA
jgi:hypothetical protein